MPKKRGLTIWPLGFLAAVILVMFIGFIAVATGIFPQGTQQTPPPVQNPPTQTPPVTSNNATSSGSWTIQSTGGVRLK